MRTIRPSAVFETRRRTALRGEGFAWVPDLWSFLKLQEVGFSPYLGFTPILNVLLMFRLNEAVRGRWIGPKTWDRIIGNFFRNFGEAVSVQSHVGAVWVDYVLIYVLICSLVCIGQEMVEKTGFTK